jgi:uncharacterized membrane protein HdeD (DUF308 family)
MLASMERSRLASQWGWIVLRGVVGVLFAFAAFSRPPGQVGLTLVLLFGIYAFVAGVATVISAARDSRAGAPNWGTLLIEGIVSMIVGAFAVLRPSLMAAAFVGVIGAWALVTGGLQLATAVRLRKLIEHEWALGLAGALSIVFGVLVLMRPLAGAVAVVWWLEAYAMVFGVLMIFLGFRLRAFARAHPTPREELHQPG